MLLLCNWADGLPFFFFLTSLQSDLWAQRCFTAAWCSCVQFSVLLLEAGGRRAADQSMRRIFIRGCVVVVVFSLKRNSPCEIPTAVEETRSEGLWADPVFARGGADAQAVSFWWKKASDRQTARYSKHSSGTLQEDTLAVLMEQVLGSCTCLNRPGEICPVEEWNKWKPTLRGRGNKILRRYNSLQAPKEQQRTEPHGVFLLLLSFFFFFFSNELTYHERKKWICGDFISSSDPSFTSLTGDSHIYIHSTCHFSCSEL